MFKKLFSLFLIALILISGCTPGTSSSAGSFLPSKTADTSARELYAPNVRQLCGDPAYYTDNSEVSLYRFPVIDDNSPYIIDSAESYREFISITLYPVGKITTPFPYGIFGLTDSTFRRSGSHMTVRFTKTKP
jgi:hypothetical protein